MSAMQAFYSFFFTEYPDQTLSLMFDNYLILINPSSLKSDNHLVISL